MLEERSLPLDQFRKLYGDEDRAREAYDRSCKECELANLRHQHPVAGWADWRMHLLEMEIRRIERSRRKGWGDGDRELEPLDPEQMEALRCLSLTHEVVHWALLEIQALEVKLSETEGKNDV